MLLLSSRLMHKTKPRGDDVLGCPTPFVTALSGTTEQGNSGTSTEGCWAVLSEGGPGPQSPRRQPPQPPILSPQPHGPERASDDLGPTLGQPGMAYRLSNSFP